MMILIWLPALGMRPDPGGREAGLAPNLCGRLSSQELSSNGCLNSGTEEWAASWRAATRRGLKPLPADTAPEQRPGLLSFGRASEGIADDSIKTCCEKLAQEKRRIYYLNERRDMMALRLNGVYIRNEALFMQIWLRNYSNIDYAVAKIGFFIRDLKPAPLNAERPEWKIPWRLGWLMPGRQDRNTGEGREAGFRPPLSPSAGRPEAGENQLEVPALYVLGNTRLIRGKATELWVYALPRFTLPKGKCLIIRIMEKNGGRTLELQTDNYTILKARVI